MVQIRATGWKTSRRSRDYIAQEVFTRFRFSSEPSRCDKSFTGHTRIYNSPLYDYDTGPNLKQGKKRSSLANLAMADELVQEAANEAREVFGRRLIRLHDHGETDAVVTRRIIRKLAESRGETLRHKSCLGWGRA